MGTSNLAVVPTTTPTSRARRIPGEAIDSNPLIGVVAYVTEANVRDLDNEIEATERYLAGLKAMRQVAEALGPTPSQPAVTVVEPQPLAIAAHTGRAATRPDEPKPGVEPSKTGGRRPSGVSEEIRKILEANFDTPAADIETQLKANGVDVSKHNIRQLIYQVRTKVRGMTARKAQLAERAAAQKVEPKPEPKPEPKAEAKPPEKKHTPLYGLVDDPKLRATIAEYLFKKGWSFLEDVVRDCKLEKDHAASFMTHRWFETFSTDGTHTKYRLSAAGKSEGVQW